MFKVNATQLIYDKENLTLSVDASDLGFRAGSPMPQQIAVVDVASGCETEFTYSGVSQSSEGELLEWHYTPVLSHPWIERLEIAND